MAVVSPLLAVVRICLPVWPDLALLQLFDEDIHNETLLYEIFNIQTIFANIETKFSNI